MFPAGIFSIHRADRFFKLKTHRVVLEPKNVLKGNLVSTGRNQKVHFHPLSNVNQNVLQSEKKAKNDWSNNGRKKRFILGQNAIFELQKKCPFFGEKMLKL
jgi:hypothetical protein